jgi:hypothetical protein
MRTALLRPVLLIVLCASAPAADDPFLGKWKLDPARSKLTGQTIEIREVPGTNQYTFKEDEHTDTILADGLDHPMHFGGTISVVQTKPDTWSIVYKKADSVTLNTIWKVSRDGRTLTYTATGTRPNGQHFTNQMTAKRTSGKSGLAGTWETTGVTLSSPREIYIEPYESDGQSITFPGRRQVIRMKFDGREYPETGPTVEEGSTSSGRRIDERTIETTERIKGKIVETAKATISADGRTHTIVVTEPGDPTPVVLVYERESK